MKLAQHNIAFIGAGHLAKCIITGLLQQNILQAQQIWATRRDQGALDLLKNQLNINVTINNQEAIKQADLIFICCRPQDFISLSSNLATTSANTDKLFISVMAGITLTQLESAFNTKKIIRAMPNMPAEKHLSATALFANKAVSEIEREAITTLFNTVGCSVWLEQESQLDVVTALSGSGPAYFFLLIEAMQMAGVKLGLPEGIAKKLSVQTALGAATMSNDSQQDASQLKAKIAVPGGTTEAALNCFVKNEFGELVEKAITAAVQRAANLSKNLERE